MTNGDLPFSNCGNQPTRCIIPDVEFGSLRLQNSVSRTHREVSVAIVFHVDQELASAELDFTHFRAHAKPNFSIVPYEQLAAILQNMFSGSVAYTGVQCPFICRRWAASGIHPNPGAHAQTRNGATSDGLFYNTPAPAI